MTILVVVHGTLAEWWDNQDSTTRHTSPVGGRSLLWNRSSCCCWRRLVVHGGCRWWIGDNDVGELNGWWLRWGSSPPYPAPSM